MSVFSLTCTIQQCPDREFSLIDAYGSLDLELFDKLGTRGKLADCSFHLRNGNKYAFVNFTSINQFESNLYSFTMTK